MASFVKSVNSTRDYRRENFVSTLGNALGGILCFANTLMDLSCHSYHIGIIHEHWYKGFQKTLERINNARSTVVTL